MYPGGQPGTLVRVGASNKGGTKRSRVCGCEADLTSTHDERFNFMTAATLAPPPARIPRRTPCTQSDAREIERLLLVRYHEHGDLEAREELCERFLPLARDLALRYTYTDEPFDDLLQVASLGLVKAIDRFEP